MAYSPSIPLATWSGRRRDAINTLATAHALVGEVDGRGRPLAIGRPVGNAYVLRVVAEFQAFVRDLHDLAAQRLVALAQPQPAYAPLLIEAVTSGRRVDRGNADLRSLSQDFRRLGLADVSARIGTYNRRWTRADRAYYGDLIALRNALAHGNQGQVDALRRKNVMDTVTWTRARLPGLDRTARALDRVVWDHLQATFGQEPW